MISSKPQHCKSDPQASSKLKSTVLLQLLRIFQTAMGCEDQDPVAQVQTIRFEGLSDGNVDEQARLHRACCDDGFFYLDMRGTAEDINAAVEDIYRLETQLFKMPEKELMQYDIDKLSSKKLNGFAI